MAKKRGTKVERGATLVARERASAGAEKDEAPLLSLQRSAGNRAVATAVREGGGELLVQRGILDWFRTKPPKVSGPKNARPMKPEEQRGALSGKDVEARKKEDDRGLAGSKLTGAFAETVLRWWRDPANKDKPLKDLGEYLLAEVNKSLQTLGSFPCNSNMSASGDDMGSFGRTTWTIAMNPKKFTTTGATKVSEITQADLAELVDTVYHEARHSEQYFRIARIQAGQKKTAEQIKTGMSIPADVAKAAFENPMEDNAPNREQIKEAAGWEAFTIGKYEVYKLKVGNARDRTNEIRDILSKYDTKKKKTTWTAMKPKFDAIQTLFDTFFDPKIAEIEKITNRDAADENVLKNLKAMKNAWTPFKAEADKTKPNIDKLRTLRQAFHNARYQAYMDYEHEKDAWATGAAAAKAFKEAANKPVPTK